MVTIVVAKLALPVGEPGSDPKFLSSEDLPDYSKAFDISLGDTGLRGIIKNMESMISDQIQVLVLFPGGWLGKKPPSEAIEERVSNYLTLCQERAIVVSGATACSFFGPKIYRKYMGTCCPDFGVLLYPAPHPEDLLNSGNVTVGDLVIALRKASLENGRLSAEDAG